MDKILDLINSFDLSAAEVTQKLYEIGDGNMLDGIRNIYFDGIDVGERSTFPNGFLNDAKETSCWQKVAIGGAGVLIGMGGTALTISLIKKHRLKKEKRALDTVAPHNPDTSADEDSD